jgi:hypothetical protein
MADLQAELARFEAELAGSIGPVSYAFWLFYTCRHIASIELSVGSGTNKVFVL